jgi:hypothetical protein
MVKSKRTAAGPVCIWWQSELEYGIRYSLPCAVLEMAN